MSDRTLSLLLACAGALTAWVVHGCASEDPVECGPGTTRVGSLCVGEDGTPLPMAAAGDAGPTTPPPGDDRPADDGSGDEPPEYGTTPPGSSSGNLPQGCDPAAGECAEWAAAILAGLNASRPARCSAALVPDERIVSVAQRHADYQATVDRLDGSSPDGSLFEQIREAGVPFMNVAAAFSVSRDGPEDVLDRWLANPDVAPLMARCDDLAGVGVSTSSTGASYVTLIMATSL